MKITIECKCGNKITMIASPKKYLQLRDNLETQYFRFDDAEYDNNGKIKEFRICCDKCKNYISLGLN